VRDVTGFLNLNLLVMQMVMRRLDLVAPLWCHAMPAQSASFSFGGIGNKIRDFDQVFLESFD
jgi:hypothetical protein